MVLKIGDQLRRYNIQPREVIYWNFFKRIRCSMGGQNCRIDDWEVIGMYEKVGRENDACIWVWS